MDVVEAWEKYGPWDFFGAHPVCKYLTNSGVGWLARKEETPSHKWSEVDSIYMNFERYRSMAAGALFFNKMLELVKRTGKGYVENPIMHKYAKQIVLQDYTQVIQPFMFGHMERKATCLWIEGVEALKQTNNVKAEMDKLPKNVSQRLHFLPPSADRDELRSKTYQGIADAMAEQWGVM